MHVLRKLLLAPVLTAALGTVLLAGCGGDSSTPHTPLGAAQGVAVEVTPPTAQLAAGGTTTFAATVTGTIDTRVTWSVVEGSGGTIDSTGRYVAPAAAGGFHVRATSVADPTASGQAAVTVLAAPPPISVAISPRTPSVAVGGTVTFTASVANATDTRVTWSVSGTSCGAISAAGVYTTPAAPATCSVVATSVQDPSKSDTTSVTVTAPVLVTVSPSPGAVDACKTLQLTATVTNTTNRSVIWSVQEGAAGGSVSASGVFTAPASAGTYHAVATSVADPGKYAITALTVTERVLSVAVNPPTTTLQPAGTQQFTATVTTTCGAFVASGP